MNENPTKMRDAELLAKHGGPRRPEKSIWEDPATGWVRARESGPGASDGRSVPATSSAPNDKRLT